MNVALGFKAHSGWAAMVVVGEDHAGYVLVDRRRVELVEHTWHKQPYHAAERLEPAAARDLVTRGIDVVRHTTVERMREAVKWERERGNEVTACAVVAGSPLPGWSIDEILRVHFRMHKAEGALFRDALAAAGKTCGLRVVEVGEQSLGALGEAASVVAMGKLAGPPWGKDQKEAAFAAMVAMANLIKHRAIPYKQQN